MMEKKLEKSKVVMLPTGEDAEIGIQEHWYTGSTICYQEKEQHLYVTSEDEIKEGDWKINEKLGIVWQHRREGKNLPNNLRSVTSIGTKKIIATTDDLQIVKAKPISSRDSGRIGYLPQPSKDFIKKYCSEGGINEVMVEYEYDEVSTKFKNAQIKGDWSKYLPENAEWRLKVNPHNEVVIHPIKNSWGKEEVIEKFRRLLEEAPNLITQYPDDTVSGIKEEEFKIWTNKNL